MKRALKQGLLAALLIAGVLPCLSFAQSFQLIKGSEVEVFTTRSITHPPHTKFEVDRSVLKELTTSSKVNIALLPLVDPANHEVQEVELDLTEFSALSPNVEIFVTTEKGLEPGPQPTVKTYRGTVRGMANSRAYLAIGPDHISGRILTNTGHYVISSAKPSSDVLYATIMDRRDAVAQAPSRSCDVTDDEKYAPFGIPIAAPATQAKGPKSPSPLVASVAAEMAIECDFEMFEFFGSNEQTVIDWVTARMASISDVYERELGCALQIKHLNVFKVNDPYPTVGGTDPLLNSFTQYWAQNKGSVQRSLALLLSRQAFDNPNYSSGLAWLNALCRKDIGYAVVRVMAPNWPGAGAVDEDVIAHEIGHNFGSSHTHNCQQWGIAIDSCVPAEGDCFSGSKQTRGTIMSYCNENDFTFGQRVQNFLIGQVEAATCLVPVSGGAGEITTSTAAITVSGVELGSSKDTTITGFFRNTDTKPRIVKGVELSGSSDFEIVSPTFPLSIAAKQSANIVIRYSANSETTQVAAATFQIDGSQAEKTLALTGMTKPDGGGGNKPLTFSAGGNTINWQEKKVGSTNDTIITVFNNTPASITTLQPKIETSVQGTFSLVGQQLITIGPGAVGQFTIRFKPQANKQYSARLIIPFGSGQDTLLLNGTGSFNPGGSGVGASRELNAEMTAMPNPFTSAVSVDLTLPAELTGEALEVEIFNVLGISVGKLYSGRITADKLQLDWQPDGLDAGTYYVVARVDDAVLTRKIVYKR